MIEELVGKSYDEIEGRLRGLKRDRLIRLLQEALTLEPHFSLETVAAMRGVTKASLLQRIREKRLRAHLPTHNRYRIPKSAVDELDVETLFSAGSPDARTGP